jgi:branched-subunit amino acid ABC-type transport system permease component
MITHFVYIFIITGVTAEYIRLVYIFHGRLNIHTAAMIAMPGYILLGMYKLGVSEYVANTLTIAATIAAVLAVDRLITQIAPPENRSSTVIGTIASIGVMILLSNAAVATFGSLAFVLDSELTTSPEIGLIILLLVFLFIYLWVQARFETDLYERAAQDDRFLLICYGLPVRRILDWVSLIGGAGLGIGGLLVARYTGVSPFTGYDLIFPAVGVAYVSSNFGSFATVASSLVVSAVLIVASLALSNDWVRVLTFSSLAVAVIASNAIRRKIK